jgi:hypothetical protein
MLEEVFRFHITQGFHKDIANKLVGSLREYGYKNEATFLQEYLRHGETKVVVKDGVWAGHTCHIGLQPPPYVYPKSPANPGDLWFDIMELTPMVFVPEVGHPKNVLQDHFWVSEHPVYVWQFRAFAEVVEWRYTISLTQPQDESRFLSTDLSEQVSTDFIHGITNEEAFAYVQWFGKLPTLQPMLRSAKALLNQNQFSCMLPEGIRLWEHTLAFAYDFRIALGRENLEQEGQHHIDQLDYDSTPDETRMWYKATTRAPDISVASSFVDREGVSSTKPPIEVFRYFVELLNSVDRSAPE